MRRYRSKYSRPSTYSKRKVYRKGRSSPLLALIRKLQSAKKPRSRYAKKRVYKKRSYSRRR